jgi:uncharacterized membrane protein (UPF0136 family)
MPEPDSSGPDSPEPDDELFPFAADHDPVAERAERGPLNRRDAIVSAVLLVVAGVTAGISAAIAVLMLLVAADIGAFLALVGPAALVLAGVVVVLVRTRARQRSWPFAAIALALALLVAVLAPVWWAADAHLV